MLSQAMKDAKPTNVQFETLLAIIHHAEQLHMLTTLRCLWLRLRGWFGLRQLQILGRGAQRCVTICPPFMYSNTANWSPFSNGPFIVASTQSLVERVKITGRPDSKRAW